MTESTPIVAFDQHAESVVAAGLIPGERKPVLHALDATRFAGARQVMGFTGLVPSEYSSGMSQKRGGITKTGNAHLRRGLVEAWHYHHRPAISHRLRVRQRDPPTPAIRCACHAVPNPRISE
jgi:transposase